MNEDCGCCEGVGVETTETLDNPPGMPALSYRVGTYATFFRTMMARLGALLAESSLVGSTAAQPGNAGCMGESHRSFLLGGDPDAGTALIDAWACVADVLTFYQERIANEGFLRTAVEQRSVIELGRLTGYEPRPGVSASAHLAFVVQPGFDGQIPASTKAQSTPRPEQTAQAFETSEPLNVRSEWNEMHARRRLSTQYIRIEYIATEDGAQPTGRIEVFLAGIDQNVQPGDVVIVERTELKPPPADNVYRTTDATRSSDLQHTTLRLVPLSDQWMRGGEWDVVPSKQAPGPLAVAPSAATVAMARARSTLGSLLTSPVIRGALGERSAVTTDAILALVAPGMPALHGRLRALLRAMTPAPAPLAWVMRVRTQVFGHNAPEIFTTTTVPVPVPEVVTAPPRPPRARAAASSSDDRATEEEDGNVLYLDGEFAALRSGSWLVMRAPPLATPTSTDLDTRVFAIDAVALQSRRAYGLSGKTTKVALSDAWWNPDDNDASGFTATIVPIRLAVVYAQAEALDLVGEPVEDDVAGSTIDLDSLLVAELPADRLLYVEGEVVGSGLPGVELVRAAGTSTEDDGTPPTPVAGGGARTLVVGAASTPGTAAPPRPAISVVGTPFSRIALTTPLRNRYKRASVVIRGNVVHATHGETRDEVLGSGDASVPEQRFTLRQGPRTWVSAATPSGVASTLDVRVSGVKWPEVRSSEILGPRDEVVRSRKLGDGRDELKGGDGRNGARFPTGVENLTARYRVGLGAAGNVGAGLVNALLTRPMGVRDVINPERTSGGADPDGRDEIRARIPIAARGIDRLVSIADHAAFALNFAGIDKAEARFEAGPADGPTAGQASVRVIIAGDEDVPIDDGSDLLVNLRTAFRRFGDATIRAVIDVAEPVPLMLQAGVRIDARHTWSFVEPALRARLIERFGWDVRAIGEAAHLSQVLAALQSVDGVVGVDVDVFGPLSTSTAKSSPAGAAARATARIQARVAGLIERLETAGEERTWSFPAGPDEILYFSRSATTLVAFQELAP